MPCEDKHEFELANNLHANPYIYKNQNWTIYNCKHCDERAYKTGPVAADGKPYIIPVEEDDLHD